jgi:hypothetical protein
MKSMSDEGRVKALSIGADDYVNKSQRFKRLFKVTDKMMNGVLKLKLFYRPRNLTRISICHIDILLFILYDKHMR